MALYFSFCLPVPPWERLPINTNLQSAQARHAYDPPSNGKETEQLSRTRFTRFPGNFQRSAIVYQLEGQLLRSGSEQADEDDAAELVLPGTIFSP